MFFDTPNPDPNTVLAIKAYIDDELVKARAKGHNTLSIPLINLTDDERTLLAISALLMKDGYRGIVSGDVFVVRPKIASD